MTHPKQNKSDSHYYIRERKRFFTALGSTLFVLGLIATGFLSGFLKITPVYAKGTTEIVVPTGDPKIVFTSTSSSDPGRKADMGLDQHIGRCTASLHKGVVHFTILNGYPGYQCTLTIGLANKGESKAMLQNVEIEAPPAMLVYAINKSTRFILQPGEEIAENFMLQITPQAKENMEYPVSIQLVFMASPDVQTNP